MNAMAPGEYMQLAIKLAKKAEGLTSPNPIVGALVVKNGIIIGEGYHHKAGEPHAEVHALKMAGEEARGATLYVTLEPCSHYGRTPPCADLVSASGIREVYVGMIDPNSLVGGKGIEKLRAAGITVHTGILEEACAAMNEPFITYMQTGIPFITLKSAMSLDGKIATRSGESKWITNEEARQEGHRLRSIHDAILTGIGTILADDPLLTCRFLGAEKGGENTSPAAAHKSTLYAAPHQPDVIILDSMGRTPSSAKLFTAEGAEGRKILIFVSKACKTSEIDRLSQAGAEVITISAAGTQGHLPIEEVLKELGQRKYLSLLVEGGSQVLAAFIEGKQFDKMITFIGNLIIGGADATPAVAGMGAARLADAAELTFRQVRIIDDNLMIEAYHTGRSGAYVHRDY